MSQKLCDKCLKEFNMSAISENFISRNFPYVHCHHDDDPVKEKCWCYNPGLELHDLFRKGWIIKFCPVCGKKLLHPMGHIW